MLGKRYYIQKEEYDVSKIVIIYLGEDGKVEDMCDFSLGVYEDGQNQERIKNIQKFIQATQKSMDEVMNILELTDEEKDICREM